MSIDVINLNLSTIGSDKMNIEFDSLSVDPLNFSKFYSEKHTINPLWDSRENSFSPKNWKIHQDEIKDFFPEPVKENDKKKQINTQNQLLMNSLMEFYKVPEHMHKMINIVNGDSKISLRIVDWFVTNYSKKYYTVYDLQLNQTNTNLSSNEGIYRFKVYNDYKLKLKAYSKKRFDPFCRWERTMLPLNEDNKYIETTIGQLNFFKWAIENNVIDYIEENYKNIENDMNLRNTTSKKKYLNGRINTSISSVDSNVSTETDVSTDSSETSDPYSFSPSFYSGENTKTRKKREELSISACKCIKKENVNIVLKF